ncbi:MAG: transposase [Betaproteobacteria bacterium]|nr:transposase [Betaproteobacteria bacterium]
MTGLSAFGDAGYASDEYERGSRQLGMRWCVQDKRKPGQNLSGSQKKRNRKYSSIRARVEYVFRVIKRQFGFTKTRYRRSVKNAIQMNMPMGLANLYLLRWQLLSILREKFVRHTHLSGDEAEVRGIR